MVALRREGVELFAADAPLVGDHLGSDALTLEPTLGGVAVTDAATEGEAGVLADGRTHGDVAHELHTGGHDDVVRTGHDALSGEVKGLLRRTALTVDRGGRNRLGPTGGEHGRTTHVEGLLADLGDATHDDVVDQRRVEVVARGDGLEDLGREVHGVPATELSVALATGGTNCIDDYGRDHGNPPGLLTGNR